MVVIVVAISIPSLLFGSGSTTALTDPGTILNVAAPDAMLLATVFVAARATRQPGASLGLSRKALPRLVVLGLVPSALYVPSIGLVYPVASLPRAVPLAVGFVWSAMTGFSEESVFLGYLQTNLEAALRARRKHYAHPCS